MKETGAVIYPRQFYNIALTMERKKLGKIRRLCQRENVKGCGITWGNIQIVYRSRLKTSSIVFEFSASNQIHSIGRYMDSFGKPWEEPPERALDSDLDL